MKDAAAECAYHEERHRRQRVANDAFYDFVQDRRQGGVARRTLDWALVLHRDRHVTNECLTERTTDEG